MIINGYQMKCNNKKTKMVINKIKEMGKEYYMVRDLYPIYQEKENKNIFYFCSNKEEMNPMYMLGFSFEGLVDDDEKINEIEQFGKYECKIEKINKEIKSEIELFF